MATSSESFGSIHGAEPLGIGASSVDSEVNIRCALNRRESLFPSELLQRALSSAQKGVVCTKSAEDSGRYNGSRPFFLTKLCLIPPFTP